MLSRGLKNSAAEPEGVGFSTKVLYGVGEIAVTTSMVLFGLFILFFYNSVMKLPGTLVGIGSALGLLWDAVIDPYIGYRSDFSSSRLGRRHAYMLVGASAMGLSFWLLLRPPQMLGTWELFFWLLGATFLFRLTSAVFRIPYLSLGAELSSDYQERTTIVAIRSFFGLLGTLGAATVSFALFFPNVDAGVDPKLDYSGYPKMGLAFGAVMTLTALVSVVGTWHQRSRPSSSHKTSSPGFLRGFLTALRIKEFRKVWLSYSLFFLAVVITATTSVHYFKWYVEINESSQISAIQLCFYLGALVGVVLWVWIAMYFEKHHLYLVSMLATATMLFGATFLFGEGNWFGTRNPEPLFFGNALAGLFASGLWVLPSSMLADIADQDELTTGLRREGVFFGILNFGDKIAAGLSILISGVLLDHFVQLVPGEFYQDSSASFRIGLMYGVLPGILLLMAALLMRGYSLDRDKLHSIQENLGRARAQLSQEYKDPFGH